MYCQLQSLKPLYMVIGALGTQIFGFEKWSVTLYIDLCWVWVFRGPVTIYNGFNGQVVIHHRYVTIVWCHMHWSSQRCLEVIIISTAMSCTIFVYLVPYIIHSFSKTSKVNEFLLNTTPTLIRSYYDVTDWWILLESHPIIQP